MSTRPLPRRFTVIIPIETTSGITQASSSTELLVCKALLSGGVKTPGRSTIAQVLSETAENGAMFTVFVHLAFFHFTLNQPGSNL